MIASFALGQLTPPRRACSWHWAFFGFAVFGGFAVYACGPSFEAIQEGDLRFAHCDRLDVDPGITASHRLHCWREWRRVYTYGQTRDRVEYAQRRIAEVVSGDTDPPFDLPGGLHAVPRHRPTPAPSNGGGPAPIDPIQPAPGGVPESDGTGSNGTALPLGAAAAKQTAPAGEPECRARCEAESSGCLPGCETKPTGCRPCEPTLEACLGLCGSAQ